MGWNSGETRCRVLESCPSGVTQDMLSSPQQNMSQDVWNVVYQDRSLETKCPVYLRGLITKTMFSWFITKSQTVRRKASVWHKPYCRKFRHNYPLLQVNGRNLPETCFQTIAKGQPYKMLSKHSSHVSYVNPFLYCHHHLFSYLLLLLYYFIVLKYI